MKFSLLAITFVLELDHKFSYALCVQRLGPLIQFFTCRIFSFVFCGSAYRLFNTLRVTLKLIYMEKKILTDKHQHIILDCFQCPSSMYNLFYKLKMSTSYACVID